MRLDEAMSILSSALPELRDLYAVKDLPCLVPWPEARPDRKVTSMSWWNLNQARLVAISNFFTLKEDLEARLGLKVDLVTPDAIRKQMRGRILAEAVHAA